MVSILNTFPILSVFLLFIDVTSAVNNSTNKTTEDDIDIGSIISSIFGVLIFGSAVVFMTILWICECKQSGCRCLKDIWSSIKSKFSCCKKCKRAKQTQRIKPSSTGVILSVNKKSTPKPISQPQPKRLQSPRQKLPPIKTPPVIIRTHGPTPSPTRPARRLERVHSMTILETKRRKDIREHELPPYRAQEHNEDIIVRPHTTKERGKRKNVLRTVPIVLKAIRRPHHDEIISMPNTTKQNDDEIFVIPSSRRQQDDVILYPESPRTIDTSDNDDIIYRYPSTYHIRNSNMDSQQIERLYDRPEFDQPPPAIYYSHQSMHDHPPPPTYDEAVSYRSHPKRYERY